MRKMSYRPRKNPMDEIFEEMNEIIQGMLDSGIVPDGKTPHVWGFSMTQIGDQPPKIQEFGNINLKDSSFIEADLQGESGVRKPLIDIMEAEDTLHVVVEMPGVAKENIILDSNGTILDIKASSDDRKYSEHVELPARVLPDSAKATYNNGVLEVVFQYDTSDKKPIKLQ
jgi:HSP20 family protein